MMDPKASAKAKRSYTQKGRRNNLSPAAIAQKKKATQAVSEEKVRRSHFHALPSNWDRYDSGEEEPETAAGKIPADGEGEVEVAPKSKGADYGYLIEQAQSQQQKHRGTAEVESSSYFFDEQPIDFMQGVSPMFTLRRKSLLSLCEDDNFIIDLDLMSNYEVPYLTMDLHALAANLSKLKLSKRLFIEEDLLPRDLVSNEFNASSSSAQSQRHEVPELVQNLGTPHSTHCPEITSIFHTDEYQNPNLLQSSTFNAREAEESIQNSSKTSTFKARGPEEELDLLLQSFGSTSISGFSHDHIFDEKPASTMAFDPSRKTFLDDSIDHLLAETSAAAAPFDELPAETSVSPTDLNFTSKTNEAASFKDQSSSLGSKSAIDDFDSWIDSF